MNICPKCGKELPEEEKVGLCYRCRNKRYKAVKNAGKAALGLAVAIVSAIVLKKK